MNQASASIEKRPEAVIALDHLNKAAAILNIEFEVKPEEAENAMAGVRIVFYDSLVRGNVVTTFGGNSAIIFDLNILCGLLSDFRNVIVKASERAPAGVEHVNAKTARLRARKIFMWLTAIAAVLFVCAVGYTISAPWFDASIALTSLSAGVAVWGANEWRLICRKNTDPEDFDTRTSKYLEHSILRAPLTLVPAATGAIVLMVALHP